MIRKNDRKRPMRLLRLDPCQLRADGPHHLYGKQSSRKRAPWQIVSAKSPSVGLAVTDVQVQVRLTILLLVEVPVPWAEDITDIGANYYFVSCKAWKNGYRILNTPKVLIYVCFQHTEFNTWAQFDSDHMSLSPKIDSTNCNNSCKVYVKRRIDLLNLYFVFVAMAET